MPPDLSLRGPYASDCRIFNSPLGAEHLLPDIFPAPLRCALDVLDELAMGARFPSVDVSVSGYSRTLSTAAYQSASVWTSDLSHKYVRINSAYRT